MLIDLLTSRSRSTQVKLYILVWSHQLTFDLKRCLRFRKCLRWSSLKAVSVPSSVIGALWGSKRPAILSNAHRLNPLRSACLGGSMVEHQPRLMGSRVRFPAGAFAIFSVSAKASLPISLSPFPSSFFTFLFLSLPLSLPSTFRLLFKISLFAFIPLLTSGAHVWSPAGLLF